jgi:hypothetical protein
MTRHNATQTGLGTPSPLDRWINAMLRGLAMLVSHVARRLASRHPISAAECDGRCDRLPEANIVLDQHPEPQPAAASSQPIEALMVSSERSSRPSNHEGGLTGIAPRGTPPLGKGRSEPAKLATGGDHFVPHPQIALRSRHPSHPREVTPTPTSLRGSRTSPFQGEESAAPA